MKRRWLWLIVLVALATFFLFPNQAKESEIEEFAEVPEVEAVQGEILQPIELNARIESFLESKDSPLAPETDYLLEHKHWKLLIAISAIESQYCKRKLSFNCWGIGGDSAYRHYESIREAITDADALITRWQARGRWHTVEDMNCHYVQPCNPNWVRVVNATLAEIETYEQPDK